LLLLKSDALELKSVFKEILWKNNFASIPGLGSFVCTYTPARLSPSGDRYMPPIQSVIFDTSRRFNDEALERYLQEKFGLTPDDAVELANSFVEGVKTSLNGGNKIVFDNLGELSKDEKGSVIFTQVEEQLLASSTYGLQTLTLKGKVSVQNKENVKFLNRSKVKLGYGIIAAVVIVGLFLSVAFIFFADFFVVNDKNPKHSPISITNTEPEEKIITPHDAYTNNENNAAQQKGVTSDEDPVAQSVQTKSNKKQALFYQEKESAGHENYYIISGSYASMENAEKHYNQLLSKGFRPEIIHGDGRYRVALVKFSDRNVALKELERIRLQNPSSSYWLLGY